MRSSPPGSGRARWPALRAAGIALAIALALLHGCPVPSLAQTPGWAHGAIAAVERARRALLAPFAEIPRRLDFFQRWALFRGAAPSRYRMWIEARAAGGPWELVHRAGDAEHAAHAAVLAYRRVRGAYNPTGKQVTGQYRAFASWMIQRALADHPRWVAGRIQMERVAIDRRGPRPTGERVFSHEEARRP
jgi:hypothetical protein